MFTGSVEDAIVFFSDDLDAGQITTEQYEEGQAFWCTFLGKLNGNGVSEADEGTVTFHFVDIGPAIAIDFDRANDPCMKPRTVF